MLDALRPADFYDRVARYYDAENEHMVQDLELYSALAEAQGAPVLEVGCGTGRVTFHLAGAGFAVTGVDLSAAMLERARRKAAGRADLNDMVSFIQADAAQAAYPDRYPLIVLPYNTMMHFHTTEAQLRLVRHLSAHLAEGGLMVIDLPNAGESFATAEDSAVTLERSFVLPESRHLVMQQSVSRLDRTAQMQSVTWLYDEISAAGTLTRTIAPVLLRYVFPAELDLLLMVCGLQRVARYGDYDESPFEEGCPRLIVYARQAAR